MIGIAAATAVLFALLERAAAAGLFPQRSSHAVLGGMALLVVASQTLRLQLAPDPRLTLNVMLTILGIGSLLLSRRWLAAALGAVWAGWGSVVWLSPVRGEWTPYAITMFGSTVVAVIVFVGRRRAVAKGDGARLQGTPDAAPVSASPGSTKRASSYSIAGQRKSIRHPLPGIPREDRRASHG